MCDFSRSYVVIKSREENKKLQICIADENAAQGLIQSVLSEVRLWHSVRAHGCGWMAHAFHGVTHPSMFLHMRYIMEPEFSKV